MNMHTHIHTWLVLILLMIWVCLKIGQPAKVAVSKVYPVLRQKHRPYLISPWNPDNPYCIPLNQHFDGWTYNWLVVWNMNFIFHFIYGMSSFPLTSIFFKMVIAPPTRQFLGGFLMITSHLEQLTQWAQDPPSLHPLQLRWPKELVVGSALLSRHLA